MLRIPQTRFIVRGSIASAGACADSASRLHKYFIDPWKQISQWGD